MWDLWWTKSQWKRFFFEYFVFPIGMSPQMLHVHSFIHISSTLYTSNKEGTAFHMTDVKKTYNKDCS
jgi:hypothetical protein